MSSSSPIRERNSNSKLLAQKSTDLVNDNPKSQPRRPGRPRRQIAPPAPQKGSDSGASPRYSRRQRANVTAEVPQEEKVLPGRVSSRRLAARRPSPDILHPLNISLPKKHSSFREWFQTEGVSDLRADFADPESALKEFHIRNKVREAGQPGGILSEEKCSIYMPDPAEEPPRQYSHQDHFIAHALYLKKLMDREKKHHQNLAKLLAYACADAWRKRHRQPEDLLRKQEEEIRKQRKQLNKDLNRQFDAVRLEIEKRKLARWEEEQKIEGQLALNKAIRQSTMLFEKRIPDRLKNVDADVADHTETYSDVTSADEMSDNDSDKGSSNMSSSIESESEDGVDDDERLTLEQLRRKYANISSQNMNVVTPPSLSRSVSLSEGGGGEVADNTAMEENGGKADEIELDTVDPVLLDDSDESESDMEDDMGDSDERSDDDDDDESEGGSDGPGLLGFFSVDELKSVEDNSEDLVEGSTNDGLAKAREEGVDNQDTSVPKGSASYEGDIEKGGDNYVSDADYRPLPISERDEFASSNRDQNIEQDPEKSNALIAQEIPDATDKTGETNKLENPTTATEHEQSSLHEATLMAAATPDHRQSQGSSISPSAKQSSSQLAADSVSSYARSKTDTPATPKGDSVNEGPPIKTPVPHLIRGSLREYQHYGLDWLVGLYDNNISGILADEMGLGKTIQTISLLAHLAVEKEIWGPHLVVVPTSVMLNWEMEFKKWCPGFKILTYYGTQEERRQKRKGWMDDNRWHVCITSYQLVLQDQQTFKRRNWHYMILDEAHNIKNFRSQRWQTLLTFKTHSRLLLTGTPLQNNLTELWSLLFFLMPSDDGDMDADGFADLRNFSEWFRRPVEQILEHGRDTMDDEAKKVVTKLHTVLRPYILRRLKLDVERQMPAKFEHVVPCRLSKRQRYLYDGFMSRAQTKETLASGNYLSIINCLMQLRKVCNHPDLFETRPIMTSYAMPRSVIADFEVKELLVRRKLLAEDHMRLAGLNFLNLVPISREDYPKRIVNDGARIAAFRPLEILRAKQRDRTNWCMEFDGSSIRSSLSSIDNSARKSRLDSLDSCLYHQSYRHSRSVVYGQSLIDFLTLDKNYVGPQSLCKPPKDRRLLLDWLSSQSSVIFSMIKSLEDRSLSMEPLIEKFACVTPSVVADGITEATLTPVSTRILKKEHVLPPFDPFHEAQMRLSIAFPDKRLLQYDCGKLQQLDLLLRRLQSGGHKALIFTQMTKLLDILEQFLNIHGHRYLRLDGATKIEQRQVLTDRFNNDPKILAFILSSRSGGLGINLTGADTVIFYDLDWNPAMDKQCQDRCHRIGQTRDVHIYRLVSEYTIESNILRKANQKRMLDDVVIQEGDFTTDYAEKLDINKVLEGGGLAEGNDEASAAMDRVLDARATRTPRAFEQAEDEEDIDAAKHAEQELEHVRDDEDFEEGSTTAPTLKPQTSQTATRTPGHGENKFSRPIGEESQEGIDNEPPFGHIDDYLLRFMEWNLKDEPLALPPDKRKKKKGQEYRVKRHR